ncbi:hypothetical protein [Burkholderia pyrrocinia]|uniref:hypothetical protein n=1 Tax=Burkholderia pyrrocinia TaxID=60550 RepID=UPI00158CD7FB|nr:hypothetical protein [Burkholderia pyrrocinia]
MSKYTRDELRSMARTVLDAKEKGERRADLLLTELANRGYSPANSLTILQALTA